VIAFINRRQVAALYRKMLRVEQKLEKANLAEFMQLIQNPVRLIFLNFLSGLARGFGIAIGLTIIASIFLVLLTRLASLNLPVIGKYIAELVRIVNQQLRLYS
jgi:Na+-transporting NADH:ubiquinone oxidoreductase subunit NqrD